jgi:hypothetical protein
MKGRTRLLIGLSLVALGLGVAAMGLFEDGSDVRYVEDMVERPAAHMHGEYTLMGIPQPIQVPLTGGTGTQLEDNPGWVNETRTVAAWTRGGTTYHSTHILSAEPGTLTSRFTFRNETRVAGDDALAFPAEETAWDAAGRAFTVQAFDDGDGDTPRVWAFYAGPLKQAMQPKPSQFTGHVLARLPDGTPLPDRAVLYQVEEFTAGCSSKFLPPEEKAQS